MLPLEHRTLNQSVHHRLRSMIESGALEPGSRLDEKALSESLGVSRTPLREAIGKLAQEGLVEHRPYRGNFVRSFTPKQVGDLYEVRKALEGLAVRLAVANMSCEDVNALRGILDAVQEALDRGDMDGYASADQRFHATLARLSGNEVLVEALERLRHRIQMVRAFANRDPDVVQRTAHERPRIVAALEARDGELASRLMEEHIEGVRRSVVAQLEDPTDTNAAS